MSHTENKGTSCLFSFPFWIMVDTTTSLPIVEIKLGEASAIFYPLFRSGAANFIPMPPINPHQIPFAPGFDVNFSPAFSLPTMAVFPVLGLSAEGTASVHLQWTPVWTQSLSVFPMDSLRVDIFGMEEKTAEGICSDAVLTFMQLLRCRSRQWWIEHAADAGNLRGSFQVLENGVPSGEQPSFRGIGGTVVGDEKAVDSNTWLETLKELEGGTVAPLYDLLVLDARYFAVTSNIRRSVLDAAVACEQARDVHYERLWNQKTGGLQYKSSRIIKGNNLPNHLSEDILKFTNNAHSYAKEHPTEFAIIENLWDCRGNVAHGRPAQYNQAGNTYVVDASKATKFAEAAGHCVRWLESL